jgi:hypothetical protein
VDMCKGKRKYDYKAPMTFSLSDCTWLEKDWMFCLSTTWHPSLHFIFSFTWFIPLISLLPILFSLFLLFLSFFHSFILIFLFFFTFLYIIFFLFHTHTFLFIFSSLDIFSKLSTLLFLACIQFEILKKPC